MTSLKPLDPLVECRPHFPSLKDGFIFGDNAGGSQVVSGVIEKITEYFVSSNVQLGANYQISKQSNDRVALGSYHVAKLINAEYPHEIAFTVNTTTSMDIVARAMEPTLCDTDEIIVTDSDHEANIGCWVRLTERRKLKLKIWKVDPQTFELPLDQLKSILSPNTRLVALTHTSNILGTLNPIKEIAALVHDSNPRAEICVDGVAYAPHRRVDVRDLNVDYYGFSFYKVYGPHLGCLYARSKSQDHLSSLGHYFFPKDYKPYNLIPGCLAYELIYSTTAILPYFLSLSTQKATLESSQEEINDALNEAFERIARHEEEMTKLLIEFLKGRKGVKIIGPDVADRDKRVPVISFLVEGKSSKMIAESFDVEGKAGIRWGMFYANRLFDALGIPDIVRISLVHCNTIEEVKYLIEGLKKVM